jgi:predicted dehydrogenase
MKTAAIIGCGRPPQNFSGHKVGWGIAYAHADGYRTAFPDAALYAVDPNGENLSAFAERVGIPLERCFASADALYRAVTPDCVSICTWPALHAPMAIDACARGVRAVLVEKPLALDTFEIRELAQHTRSRGTRVAVAHQRRYEAPFVHARRLIAAGSVGSKLVLDARVGDDWDMLSWTVHWFDMANFLLDARPVSVLAGVQHTGQRRYGHAIEDASTVFVTYDRGHQANFVTGPAALPQAGISVRGENGMLVIDDNKLRLWTTAGYQEISPEPVPFANAFASLFRDLWQSAGSDAVSRCDVRLTGVATEMAYAAHQSAATMQTVALPSATWYAPLEVVQHRAAPASSAPAGLRVTLLTDAHSEWPEQPMSGRDGLHDALVALGHTVTLLRADAELSGDALNECDLLVIYHTQREAAASHKDVVGRWIRSGKPVVVSHCGIGAYADWPDYRGWTGKHWVWSGEAGQPSLHPHVPCELTRIDPQFDVGWSKAWLPLDEMYQNLGDASPTRVLVTATPPDGQPQPMGWQVKQTPHVVVWLPGHRRDMFDLPAVRDGLRASIELALAAAASKR